MRGRTQCAPTDGKGQGNDKRQRRQAGMPALREDISIVAWRRRLLPVMRQGGFIAGMDHQTPPEVSLQDYRLYVRLLREYCEEAARG